MGLALLPVEKSFSIAFFMEDFREECQHSASLCGYGHGAEPLMMLVEEMSCFCCLCRTGHRFGWEQSFGQSSSWAVPFQRNRCPRKRKFRGFFHNGQSASCRDPNQSVGTFGINYTTERWMNVQFKRIPISEGGGGRYGCPAVLVQFEPMAQERRSFH